MLSLIQPKPGLFSASGLRTVDAKPTGFSKTGEAGGEFTPSSQDQTKASEWDTMSRLEKVTASGIGGWLGLSFVGTLLAVATPIAGPLALGIGFAAGIGAAQAKGRLLKSDLTKAEAAREKIERAAEPVAWKPMSGVEKAQGIGAVGGVGALLLGSVIAAATPLAGPVALAVGAAAGVAGGVGLLNVARDSDFQDWQPLSSSDRDKDIRMTTDGRLQVGLGGGVYMGMDGKYGVDYGGQLTGFDGKSQGRFLS